MPAIHRISRSPDFVELSTIGLMRGERNDCSVIALSLLARLPYEVVHEALEKQGRVKGTGTFIDQVEKACIDLDKPLFRPRTWRTDIRSRYPRRTKVKGMTTHHPRRFPEAFKGCPDLLLRSRSHMAAMIDGELKDWSVNNALRIVDLLILESDRDKWEAFVNSEK